MSAASRTPPASCAAYWRKENSEARSTTRRLARREDRAVLRDILSGGDFAAAIFSADLGTQGRLTY